MNLQSILVLLAVAVGFFFAVRHGKKKYKCGCCGDCKTCANRGSCK